ncbi:high-temperature-induced dauer-formation protein-domain-containing protein [Crucibulum laeve]|uniref:High-temperature-induced dauer-formation protein-domain-containing protein n=1 Tax=Crucibulum laeve TaxID=68775 RepID=A0A5C3MC68_9AGAR|nr:high-temperature-induced dauer-formation protein-domain-containing protein [Crucibulum laeve]
MFSKIPQKFTAPFGILGDEAKLAFPSQPNGIMKLLTVRNIAENDSYWEQYFVLFDSASDVFSLITPNHIRRALLDAPENVATLIRVVCSRLFNLISDHTFPSSTSTSVTAFASSIMKTGLVERNTTKEVLNCVRIFQRVLPVIFEVEGESNAFELELLWKEITEEEVPDESTDTPQFVIEDEDDDTEHENERQNSSQHSSPTPKRSKQLPSLGERLFSSIIDLLFCCGFTLPTKIQVDHHKVNYVIWEKGIGTMTDPGPSHSYDSNKTEVLRLLLILLSRQIYVPPGSLFSKPSLYSLHLVQKTPRRDVLTILCSLLNTAMNSSTSSDTSLGGMAGKLPYNHLVFKGEDPRANLVSICFQVLCVLLDFQSGTARDNITEKGDGQIISPTARTNSFRYFVMKLHRTQDFEFILKGVMGILGQHMAALNNLLPGARRSLTYLPENIIFFWKMIELNKKFRTFVLDSDVSMDLVAYLLCYCVEVKDKPQQHGLCRAISYIIQTLSAEPSFGIKLTNPIKAQLPTKWNAPGTAADFLINAIYTIVATTSGTLNSLYPALIIALSNSAPYFKNLTVIASTRLLQLMNSFSNPLFLLSDEGHPRLLFFMLEVLNSIIFHHVAENPNVIYGILTAHKTFEDLGTFTLSRGLREIKRVQVAKEELARKQANSAKNVAINDTRNSSEAGAEKARLLESERHDESRKQSEDLPGGSPRPIDEGGVEQAEDSVMTRTLMSPTSEAAPSAASATPASEKARGKMKARRSMSLDTITSLERIAASGIGRNGFIPTQEWVTSWQQGLPLDTVMLVISELLPKIQELQASRKVNSTSGIADFLSSVNLQHVLPSTPPIIPRKFMWSDASIVWLTSLIWGEIYVHGMTPLGIWNATNVRLFYVKHTQTQQRQITEAVSSVVGGFLRRTSDSTRAQAGQRS